MRFKGTTILFVVFLALGAYVYFAEVRGREDREQQEAAAKKAVEFEAADIAEITLKSAGSTVAGVRRGERQWEITDPPGIEADVDEWENLSQSIAGIQRDEVIAAVPDADLAQFGLDQPTVEIGVRLTDGRSTQILFGAENPRKTLNYVKLSGSADVLLSSTKAESLRKSLTDLRNKKVLDLVAEDIDAVSFQGFNLRKSGQDWVLSQPIQTKADASEVSTLLSTIQFARASGFADPSIDLRAAGLDRPAWQLTLHDAKNNVDRVLLIGDESGPEARYAKDRSRDAIFIIDNQISDRLQRPVFDWRDKTIVEFDREKIEEITIVSGAETVSFKKSGSDWVLADGRKLQWDKVSGMLNTLEFEKAKDIIDSPRALSGYGLDMPRVSVVFRLSGGSELQMAFGSPSANPEGVYFRQSGSSPVLVVSRDVLDSFNVKAGDLVEAPSGGPAAQ